MMIGIKKLGHDSEKLGHDLVQIFEF